jgi:hypothetical protein
VGEPGHLERRVGLLSKAHHIRVADGLDQLAPGVVRPGGEAPQEGRGRDAEEGGHRCELVLTDDADLDAGPVGEAHVAQDQHRRQDSDHVEEGYAEDTCLHQSLLLNSFPPFTSLCLGSRCNQRLLLARAWRLIIQGTFTFTSLFSGSYLPRSTYYLQLILSGNKHSLSFINRH